MMSSGLKTLAILTKKENLSTATPCLVGIANHNRIHAEVSRIQSKVQVRKQAHRLFPISPNRGFTVQRARRLSGNVRDIRGRHLKIVGIKGKHAVEIVRIPGSN